MKKAKRVAALDFGTNTFLLLVVDVRDGHIENVVHDQVTIVRLGEGVHQNRAFSEGALQRADACLREYRATLDKLGVAETLAVATSAARDVKNRDDFFAVCERWSIPTKVISGDQEARLTFDGTASGLSNIEGVVAVDIGGGSTEIVRRDSSGRVVGKSFDVGCVRLAEMFISENPVPRSESEKLRVYARDILSGYEGGKAKRVVAVAGTPTTLACLDQNIDFQADKVDGYSLSRKAIQNWEDKLSSMSIDERVKLKSLERGRADVIVPGAILLDLCAEILGVDDVQVSIRGIRYGVALELGEGP